MSILWDFLKFFVTTRAGRIFAGLILGVLIIYGLYQKVYHDGISAERERIEQQSRKDADAARKIERDAAPCIADVNCVLPDPFRMPRVQPDQGK